MTEGSTKGGTTGAPGDAQPPPPKFSHAMSKKYKDATSLEEILDERFPDGNYHVTVTRDRWILLLPTQLTQEEFKQLEKSIEEHY